MYIDHRGWSVVLPAIVLGWLLLPCAWAVEERGSSSEQLVSDKQALTVAEKLELKRAIEDYQFQEQAKSIARLEKLTQDHPTNLEVLHYLGLSYEETQQYAKAQGVYAHWLKYSGNRMDKDARFAWVGMAKAYDKTKHTAMGIKLLRVWLSKHPEDYDATVALGDMLVREKQFADVRTLFHNMLKRKDVPVGNQSSARYYLGYAAWLEGDVAELKSQGMRLLQVDPQSGFAGVIKQLMETPPARRLGLNVTAGMDAFYVDNVESKPSYRTATKGNSRTPGINLALGLTWNFRNHVSVNYNLAEILYSRRPDLDIGLHMLGLTWADHGIQFGPRYEYVTMYNKLLYQGIGADFGFMLGKWMMLESVRMKAFSRAVKVIDTNGNVLTPDLSYLSGLNSSLMVMRQASWGQTLWMLGGNIVLERTRGKGRQDQSIIIPGDQVNRVRGSDSFDQVGGSLSVIYPSGDLTYNFDINGYIKKYKAVDKALPAPGLNAKRKDQYLHLGGGVTWKPEGQLHHALSLKTEWNHNASNYDFPNLPNGTPDSRSASSATYSQWKHTIGYAFTW